MRAHAVHTLPRTHEWGKGTKLVRSAPSIHVHPDTYIEQTSQCQSQPYLVLTKNHWDNDMSETLT